jgi:hypothetical protein
MIIAGLSVTQDYQVLFNGLMMGPGTPYGILSYISLMVPCSTCRST